MVSSLFSAYVPRDARRLLLNSMSLLNAMDCGYKKNKHLLATASAADLWHSMIGCARRPLAFDEWMSGSFEGSGLDVELRVLDLKLLAID